MKDLFNKYNWVKKESFYYANGFYFVTRNAIRSCREEFHWYYRPSKKSNSNYFSFGYQTNSKVSAKRVVSFLKKLESKLKIEKLSNFLIDDEKIILNCSWWWKEYPVRFQFLTAFIKTVAKNNVKTLSDVFDKPAYFRNGAKIAAELFINGFNKQTCKSRGWVKTFFYLNKDGVLKKLTKEEDKNKIISE